MVVRGGMVRGVLRLAGGFVAGCLLMTAASVAAQGPSPATIQAALRGFLAQVHTWTATQTFNNIVVSGCTGCGGSSFTGTTAQWTLGDGSFTQTVTGGTVVVSTPYTISQTWNAGAVTFEGLKLAVTNTAQANLSKYFNITNAKGDIFTVHYDTTTGSACLDLNTNASDTGNSYNWALQTVAGGNLVALGGACGGVGTRPFFSNTISIGTNFGASPIYKLDRSNGIQIAGNLPIQFFSSGADVSGSADGGLARNAAGVLEVNNGTVGTFRDIKARVHSLSNTDGTSFIEGFEQSGVPTAPAANGGRIFLQDNGAGKTQLCVIFNTGAAQCFATQP